MPFKNEVSLMSVNQGLTNGMTKSKLGVMSKERLREWLAGKGWSQEEAAHRIGVSLRTFTRWLAGKSRPRSLLVIYRLRDLGIK